MARGGKREGAGRKPDGELKHRRYFSLTDEQHELVKAFVKQLRDKQTEISDKDDFVFDEAKYAQAAPLMDRLFEKYLAIGRTLPEFVETLIEVFSPEAKPYIRRFMIEKRDQMNGLADSPSGVKVPYVGEIGD